MGWAGLALIVNVATAGFCFSSISATGVCLMKGCYHIVCGMLILGYGVEIEHVVSYNVLYWCSV